MTIGEALRRFLDGHSLFQLELAQLSPPVPASETLSRDQLYNMAAAMLVDDGLDLSLFKHEPSPSPKHEIPKLIKDRALSSPTSRYHVNFVYNDVFIRGVDAANYIKDDYPKDIFTFKSPDGSKFPRYRHYPSSQLTFGFKMNDQGWRSEGITLEKPPKTIRIAALGDSTTLHQGQIMISHLDYLEKWLEIWAHKHGFDINIEVLNSGREAISSEDVAAIFIHEIMPFEPDYVLFYGLGNQWDIYPFVSINEPVKRSADGAADYFETSFLTESLLETIKPYRNHSATVAWAMNRLQTSAGKSGGEPRKPSQNWGFPTGLSERNPDPENLLRGSGSARMIRDLKTINQVAKDSNARLFVQTFKFLAHDGLVLPLPEAQGIFNYLNYSYFPYTYNNISRAVNYMNRVYGAWAEDQGVPLFDIASAIPDDHRLFVDAMHNSQSGVKLRAWALFQNLLPHFAADLQSKTLPRPDIVPLAHHPFPLVPVTIHVKDILGQN